MDVRAKNPWASAPKSAFSCSPGDGEKLFDPRASGRYGQERLQEIPTKKFIFMLLFFPEKMQGDKSVSLLLQEDEWSRSCREINLHPRLPWNFMTHGLLHPSGAQKV